MTNHIFIKGYNEPGSLGYGIKVLKNITFKRNKGVKNINFNNKFSEQSKTNEIEEKGQVLVETTSLHRVVLTLC